MAPTAHTPGHPVRRVAVACALALGTLLALPATPAAAWTEGPCPDRTGVTVVVDFAGFRDQTIVRCAPAPVESGYDALTKVGIDWTPTQRFPGFLCRIDGLPADDPCVNTPPPDAYWQYWRADYGGSWRYSTYGPSTTSPAPGPVEGWRFSTGDDQPPRVAPPPPPPPAPAPEPTSSPSRTPAPPPASSPAAPPPAPTPTEAPTTSSPTTTPSPDEAPEATDDTATPSSPSETPSTSGPSPSTGPSSDVPTDLATTSPDDAAELDDDAAAATFEGDEAPPVATLVGVGLVALVGGGAAWTSRRRRRP